MSSDQTPAAGPFTIGVHALPGGVELDVSAYLGHLLLSLADQAEEDPEALIDSLTGLADAARAARKAGPNSGAARERDEMTETLIARHTGRGRIPVYRQQALRLVEQMWQLVRPRSIPAQPSQYDEGGAAA